MYLRTTRRTNQDGTTVTYYHLAHNVRHPTTKRSVPKIIHNFGRADELDRQQLLRLCKSIARVCGAEVRDLLAHGESDQSASCLPKGVSLIGSVELGTPWVIEQLWERLGLGQGLRRIMAARGYKVPYERALLAMTANRLCEPESKLGVWDRWLPRVYLPSCQDLKLAQMYEAMDLLHDHAAEVEEEVFFKVANLFNLDVDVVFYDTTTASFAVDWEDEEEDGESLRRFGYPKEGGWAPQVIVALAVTREGFPVRSWVFPGNTPDIQTIERVKSDLRGWQLHRTLFVADAGLNGKEAKKTLARACGKYLLATRLNSVKEIREQVLSAKGRYRQIQENLQAKEVVVGEGVGRRRYVLCYNPKQAEREHAHREGLVAKLEEELAGHPLADANAQWAVDLRASRRFGRYLRVTKGGLLKLDRQAVKDAARSDGKWVLETNDDSLPIEEAATTYKALLVIERCFRTLKTTQIRMRPMYHWAPRRIEAHVKICVLALLIERVAEDRCGKTWRWIREALRQIEATQFGTKTFYFFERNSPSKPARKILEALGIQLPPRVFGTVPRN